jgi:hypothetical protein
MQRAVDGIYAYIANDSPHYAKRVIDRIVRRAGQRRHDATRGNDRT